jgi:hypothetical protein
VAAGEKRTGNGKLPLFRTNPKKSTESQLSDAPPENEYILFPERNWGAMGVYCEVVDI